MYNQPATNLYTHYYKHPDSNMSSPLANTNRSFLQKKLIRLHQTASHNHRIATLSKLIAAAIQSVQDEKKLPIIDIGCGDMKMLYAIKTQLLNADVTGLDIYELPNHLKEDCYWSIYQPFDGYHIPMQKGAVSVALLIDVLHHLPENEQQNLLKEAVRVADYVIIKDHFEYGFFSRQMLRLMDFAGNWPYGVSVPRRYFTCSNFELVVQKAGLKEITLQKNIELYNHNHILKRVLKRKWQFLYVGKSNR